MITNVYTDYGFIDIRTMMVLLLGHNLYKSILLLVPTTSCYYYY